MKIKVYYNLVGGDLEVEVPASWLYVEDGRIEFSPKEDIGKKLREAVQELVTGEVDMVGVYQEDGRLSM